MTDMTGEEGIGQDRTGQEKEANVVYDTTSRLRAGQGKALEEGVDK